MTYLGSSSIDQAVLKEMELAAQCYVDMEALKTAVGRLAGCLTGAEAGCVTACSAAGISIAVASVLTGCDLFRVEKLPQIDWNPCEIIIQRGHMVNFGANIEQAIRLTGAGLKEIGMVTGTKEYHLRGAVDERTAAVVYVISHHAVYNGMLSLEQVISIAHEYDIPVIVDAAAETDFKYLAACGADYVILSGHKAIGGPTSGLIIGSENRMKACRMQDKGIARMMKIGKENIIGMYAALEKYMKRDAQDEVKGLQRIAENLRGLLREIEGIETWVAWDATRPVPRTHLKIDGNNKVTAKYLIKQLEHGNPSIRTRNHLVDEGIIQFDPRELKTEEVPQIVHRIKEVLQSEGDII